MEGLDICLVVTLLFQCELFLHMTKCPDNGAIFCLISSRFLLWCCNM